MTSQRPTLDLIAANHPLIRIAFRQGNAPKQFSRFVTLLRSVKDLAASVQERQKRALKVLTELKSLRLAEETRLAFELEWLQTVSLDPGGPALLFALADVQLRLGRCQISPPGWFKEKRGQLSLELPRIEPEGKGVGQNELDGTIYVARRTWKSIVQLGIDEIASQRLDQWSENDCIVGIQALILAVAIISPTDKHDANSALKLFDGRGLGLWNALHQQMSGASPSYPRASHSEAQRSLLLHLRGRAAAARLATQAVGGTPTRYQSRPETPVLLGPVQPSSDPRDAEFLKEFSPLALPMPLHQMPCARALSEAFVSLHTEFPWAHTAIRQLRQGLQIAQRLGVRTLRFGPLLLVGPPGSGKSRLCRRIAEIFGLPYLPIGCAGAHDAKLLSGTSRGWAGGEPSPILRTLLQHRTGSAFVLLDEVDKAAANGAGSPPLTSLLLSLLEPETSKRWRDSYLLTECDLSNVSFCATANGLQGISRPLLSRFTCVVVPQPSEEHLTCLVAGITRDFEREWCLQPGMLPEVPTHLFQNQKIDARVLKRVVLNYLSDWCDATLTPGRLH